MNGTPPAAGFCDAGRKLQHPTRAGWQRPCPQPATHTLLTTFNDPGEDGRTEAMVFCGVHIRDLDAMGVTLWIPITGGDGRSSTHG